MRTSIRSAVSVAALLVLTSAAAGAQSPSVVRDLIKDIGELEEKMVGLARAMPEASYAWRPSPGTRTTAEVFQHVAADNYLLPTGVGVSPPAATAIVGSDYKTVQAYETRKASRDEIIADLTRSFAHLKAAMEQANAAQLADSVKMFGQAFTRQQWWILTATHLHEHLGQMIAYARSNNVKPPWSR
jgi:DinB family protein